MKSSYENLGKLLKVLDEQVLRLYNGVFYREVVNQEEGIVENRRKDEQLRTVLSEAYARYRNETDEENRTPEGFRQYVRTNNSLNRADELLSNLKELFERVNELELSDQQTENLRLMMVKSITPEEMTSPFLVKSIQQAEK